MKMKLNKYICLLVYLLVTVSMLNCNRLQPGSCHRNLTQKNSITQHQGFKNEVTLSEVFPQNPLRNNLSETNQTNTTLTFPESNVTIEAVIKGYFYSSKYYEYTNQFLNNIKEGELREYWIEILIKKKVVISV